MSKQKRARHVIRGPQACKASAVPLCRLPLCGRGVIIAPQATDFRQQPLTRSAPMNSTALKFFRRTLYFLLLLTAVLVILGVWSEDAAQQHSGAGAQRMFCRFRRRRRYNREVVVCSNHHVCCCILIRILCFNYGPFIKRLGIIDEFD